MRLDKTELVIEEMDNALDADETAAIGAYVAQFAAIQFCAEMQTKLKTIVQRSAAIHFPAAREFSGNACDRLLRSVKKSELAGFLGQFSGDIKEHFNSKVDDRVAGIYNRVVLARHDIAHGKISDITPEDIRSGVGAATAVLSAFDEALGLLARGTEGGADVPTAPPQS